MSEDTTKLAEQGETLLEAEEEGQKEDKSNVDSEELKAMIEAGLFYGRRKNKTHPKMKEYIVANRNNVEMIDLNKTAPLLDKALTFIEEQAQAGKKMILVATQPALRDQVKELAEQFKFPYVVDKWVGGALTNFDIIRKRVDYFTKIKEQKEAGVLKKYNKKEQAKINRELAKMDFLFAGIEQMNRLPEVMLIINPKLHQTALAEAKHKNIPVVAIMSTDTNPEIVDYPILANDNSRVAVAFILGKIKAILQAVAETKAS